MSLSVFDFNENLEVTTGMRVDGELKRVDAYMHIYNIPEISLKWQRCVTCDSTFDGDSLCIVLWNKPTRHYPEGNREVLIPCYECENLSIYNCEALK